jgi:uncharacterized membrane protein
VGWRLSLNLMPAFAVVLWALGWSMILMAALIHLPRIVLAIGSVVLIAGHNLLDGLTPDAMSAMWGGLWRAIHGPPGFIVPGKLLIAYPIVPWVAVMALGSLLAAYYMESPEERRRKFVTWGVAATALFLVLRGVNMYGDPGPWTSQRTAALTVASFLNVRKYPPSLLFLLMTLGPALIALALVEGKNNRMTRWLAVYGRVPLFYYVVHIFIAHFIGMALALMQGGVLMRIPVMTNPAGIPAWYGVGLPGVYLAWATVVALMYWPCKRMAELKATRREWWIRYL